MSKSNQTLTSDLMGFLNKNLLEREQKIIALRAGISEESDSPMTLGAIGDQFDLSRERIRQIEANARAELSKTEIFQKFESKVNELAQSCELTDTSLILENIQDEWLTTDTRGINAAEFMLATMTPAMNLIPMKVSGKKIHVITTVTRSDWREIETNTRQLFKLAAENQWSRHHVEKLLIENIISADPTLREAIWMRFKNEVFFADNGDDTFIISFGKGIENEIKAMLFEAPSPMHFEDIHAEMISRTGRKSIDIRRVHQAVSSSAFLYSRGTYGLINHYPFDDETTKKIGEKAAQIILSSPRQWHVHELVPVVAPELDESESSALNEYLLNIALKIVNHENVCNMQKMIWTSCDSDTARINIQELAAEIIAKHGEPMSNKDIQEKISEIRGLGQHFQIHEDDRIVRVNTGLWFLRQ